MRTEKIEIVKTHLEMETKPDYLTRVVSGCPNAKWR